MNNLIEFNFQFEDQTYSSTITLDQSVSILIETIKNIIESKTNKKLSTQSFKLRYGFPPQTITYSDFRVLSEVNITTKEFFQVTAEVEISSKIKRHIVKANNHCLFTAFNYCFAQNDTEYQGLREICADTIEENSYLYTSEVLGKSVTEYLDNLRKDMWGSYIEATILSNTFQVAISIFDIKNSRFERINTEVCI